MFGCPRGWGGPGVEIGRDSAHRATLHPPSAETPVTPGCWLAVVTDTHRCVLGRLVRGWGACGVVAVARPRQSTSHDGGG